VNRRNFLSTLVAAAAGMTLDPERLLWVPGQKTIFIPSPKQTLMYDELLSSTLIDWHALMIKNIMRTNTLLFHLENDRPHSAFVIEVK
jgi:hypothetical protein